MTEYTKNGSCLCGAVTYQITGHIGIFQYCHCSRCRKLTGTAFASNIFVKPDQFTWTKGADQIGIYHLPDTKHFATSFCKNCGSTLPWRAQSGKVVVVPAGTLDQDPELRPTQNIFCSSRAEWYETPEKLQEFEELPKR